jgi:hypothetical protein
MQPNVIAPKLNLTHEFTILIVKSTLQGVRHAEKCPVWYGYTLNRNAGMG